MEKKFEINGVKVVFFTSLENGNNAFSFRAITSEADANYDLVEAEKPYTMNDIMYRGGYVAYDEYYVSFSDFIAFCVKNNVFDNKTAAAIMEAWNNFINKAKGTNTEVEKKKMAKIEGFITNLGKYNEGELTGKWIEFPISDDELQAVLKEIGCYYVDDDGVEHNVEYEEYFFTDWNNEIAFDFGEYPDLEEVNEFAERVEALDDDEQEYLELIMEEHASNFQEALDIIEGDKYTVWNDCYCMADVAERMAAGFGDLNDVPEHLQYYIDYEKWGRDLDIEGTYLAGDDYYLEILN